MKPDKFLHSYHLSMIASSTCVQPLNDGRDVPEDAGIHERCRSLLGGEGKGEKKVGVWGGDGERLVSVYIFFCYIKHMIVKLLFLHLKAWNLAMSTVHL